MRLVRFYYEDEAPGFRIVERLISQYKGVYRYQSRKRIQFLHCPSLARNVSDCQRQISQKPTSDPKQLLVNCDPSAIAISFSRVSD